jgi:hypothetical protein
MVLRWVLLAAAAHSCATGVGLLLQPEWLLVWGGWRSPCEPFFPAQGGVFHVLMAGLYLHAATSARRRWLLLPFIAVVKVTATVFLTSYVLFVKNIWMVSLSAAVDGLFAAAFVLLWYARPRGEGGP